MSGKIQNSDIFNGWENSNIFNGWENTDIFNGWENSDIFYGWENLEIYCVTPVHAVSAAALKFDLCD